MDKHRIELPVEIWTKIFALIQNYETLFSAVFVCRDFYHIVYPKVVSLRRCHEVAVLGYNYDPTYFYDIYMQPHYLGKQDRGSKFGEYYQIESKLYSVNDKRFVLHRFEDGAYKPQYPLSLHFDLSLVFTYDLPNRLQSWGFDWNEFRECLLRNAPIIIAIPMTKGDLITEQNYYNQVSMVQKYVKAVDALTFSVTLVPFIRDIAHEELCICLPWYTGPDLLTALTNINKIAGTSHNKTKFLVIKPISETRCLGMLRHGTLKVQDQVNTLSGLKTVKSIKFQGENLHRVPTGVEVELELDEPGQFPNPSLRKFGLIGTDIKSVKDICAKVFINRTFYSKGTRNGLITMIHFLGGRAKCKIEIEKMLECSKRQYDLRNKMDPPEKYYYSTYNFLRKTLDRNVLGLVKLTPRDGQLAHVMTLSESPDLSRFYITENSQWIGLGVVLKRVF